jgi:beta-galactosidase/beta-glucuronidase
MYDLADTHPTPQLARPRWLDLAGTWQFAFDPDEAGRDGRWQDEPSRFDRVITVPFPPESAASGIGDVGPHRVVWYRREIDLGGLPRAAGERLLLRFGAVDYRADVWVNGAHVAFHEGGHTPFQADITHALDGDTAVIVVRAEDDPLDLTQPRGKQDWETPSHGIWYRRTTGIWQPVWLEAVGAHRIADIHWRPDAPARALGATVTVSPRPERPLTLRVELSLHGAVLADDRFTVTTDTHQARWSLDRPDDWEVRRLLWSPESPNLVEATLTLLDGETVLDTIRSYAGIRSVAVEEGGLILNGFPRYLRLVLAQNFWPQSHLAAPSAEAIRREVELIRELGFNGARIHQKVEDPRFLSWCDRLGVLVWGEMPSTLMWSDRTVTRVTREWTDAVLRDRSHPSVVAWVPMNESWGVPALTIDPRQRHWLEALWHLTHALDGSRPVVSNDGWELGTSDIVAIHDYDSNGAKLGERYGALLAETLAANRPNRRILHLTPGGNVGKPVMLTEYGGISYAPTSGQRWYGYGTVGSPEEYISKVRELTEAVRACPGVSGFCYTQLTDTEQETNGLVTEDREPKLPVETLREIFGA